MLSSCSGIVNSLVKTATPFEKLSTVKFCALLIGLMKIISLSLNPTFILEVKRKIYENIFVKKKLSSKNLVENFIRIAKTILE